MIGFIGGGNMAEALIKGMVHSGGRREVLVAEPREDRRQYLEKAYGVITTRSNKSVVVSCPLVILAVKPQAMDAVLDEIADVVNEDHTVVSIAAGITLPFLQARLRTRKLIRVMPNTPALVQEGVSVISLGECFPDRDIAPVREVFMSVGRVLVLPERHMDAVTALSGSGPAFVALFTEALIEAGTAMGLGREQAAELAIQTTIGTARLLETGMPPDRLREMVTSPGGTTAAGLKAFSEQGFVQVVVKALQAARQRATELGRRE